MRISPKAASVAIGRVIRGFEMTRSVKPVKRTKVSAKRAGDVLPGAPEPDVVLSNSSPASNAPTVTQPKQERKRQTTGSASNPSVVLQEKLGTSAFIDLHNAMFRSAVETFAAVVDCSARLAAS